jgi:hypothetical protein
MKALTILRLGLQASPAGLEWLASPDERAGPTGRLVREKPVATCQ